MITYPEIEKLKSYLEGREISFKKLETKDPYFFPIQFSINDKNWKIFIDDEHEDFDLNNPLACLYLTLLALDTYDYSDDYLNWCTQYNLNSSDLKWLDYFKSLDKTYNDIESIFGEINPCLSDYDYTLRTGVVDALLKG